MLTVNIYQMMTTETDQQPTTERTEPESYVVRLAITGVTPGGVQLEPHAHVTVAFLGPVVDTKMQFHIDAAKELGEKLLEYAPITGEVTGNSMFGVNRDIPVLLMKFSPAVEEILQEFFQIHAKHKYASNKFHFTIKHFEDLADTACGTQYVFHALDIKQVGMNNSLINIPLIKELMET
jgi:2'-5' RNA ligase